MRWPGSWKSPSAVGLLKGTPINWLLFDKDPGLAPIMEQARQAGLTVVRDGDVPAGTTVVAGDWPGVAMGRGGGGASAGPTGVPWVDTNSWKIRLETARHPGVNVCVDVAPKGPRFSPGGYRTAISDAAAVGGRWAISLDPALATGIVENTAASLATWKEITATAAFFAARKTWPALQPEAVAGVISDFEGENEFMGTELLNLIGRTNQQYAILVKSKLAANPFRGLRAVIYADAQPPTPELRKQILDFVTAGGLLITGPKWGGTPGAPAKDEHPRYAARTLGKGRVAMARQDPDDPYVLANDSTLLISHRHDLVRFWNGGAVGAYLAVAPDRKRAVAHLMFYADRGPDHASVRVAGRYRKAMLWTPGSAEASPVEMEIQKDAVELHLPQVAQYVAAELEA
ncbi:MAG: hypothetical protein ABI806_24160 [Candidatus Solibacter sp.]